MGDTIYDEWSFEGTKPLDILNEPAFLIYVKPILAQLDSAFPKNTGLFTEALKKEWYLEPKQLGRCAPSDSILKTVGDPIACQNRQRVRISMDWYATKRDSQNKNSQELKQAKVILHELLRGYVLSHPGISDESLEAVFRFLLQDPFPRPEELKRKLKFEDFGEFPTLGELEKESQRQELVKILEDRVRSMRTECNALKGKDQTQYIECRKELLSTEKALIRSNIGTVYSPEAAEIACGMAERSYRAETMALENLGANLSGVLSTLLDDSPKTR